MTEAENLRILERGKMTYTRSFTFFALYERSILSLQMVMSKLGL